MVNFGPLPTELAHIPKNPVLYILMRSDMDSMNPGKAVAQGSHATMQFYSAVEARAAFEDPIVELMNIWVNEGDGFGTTICLGVTGWQLEKLVEFAKESGIVAGITHDPEYPLRDGSTTHLLPLDTCGYMFGDKKALSILLGQFGLLP